MILYKNYIEIYRIIDIVFLDLGNCETRATHMQS